jgi:hypothetical protein
MSNVTAKQILEAALELIRPQGAWSRDQPRVLVDGLIVQRDLYTAIYDAAGQFGYLHGTDEYEHAIALAYGETGGKGLTVYNRLPDVTHAHIFALLERAIVVAAKDPVAS